MTPTKYAVLVDTMARMSLKADAARYFFGYVWWLMEPLLYVIVFYVVFELILKNPRENFLVFLMCGKLSFIWFSKSVSQASRSIFVARGLIGNADIDKTLFPIATIQEGLYKQVTVFALLFLILAFNGYPPSASWGWLLPLILVNYIAIVACSLVGAFLVCLMYDFNVFINLGMIFLLFTSGIFWDPRELAPATTELVLTLNPIAFLVDAYRQILLVGVAPDPLHLAAVGAGFGLLVWAMVLLIRRSSQFLALKVVTA